MTADRVVQPSETRAQAGLSPDAARGASPGDATTVIASILQTQYVRYLTISTWAIGLLPICGLPTAALWFALTSFAGFVRGVVERRIVVRKGSGYGPEFLAVAALTTSFWAAAPILCWQSGHHFGPAMAIALLSVGFILVFSQLRNSPRQALIVSSPYSLALAYMLVSAWNSPDFWPLLAWVPFLATGIGVSVMLSLLQSAKIAAFQRDQAHLIEQLEQERDRAQAANQTKSAFLAMISHELRTPLNGVLGAAQLLQASNLSTVQRNYVELILNSGDGLLALLNDILDTTKIEAGQMSLDHTDVELLGLITKVSDHWRPRALQKSLKYDVIGLEQLPHIAVGDANRISQVLHNLLSNAIKFTEKGAITLTIRAEKLDEGHARINLAIKDSGPGIEDKDHERLFNPFEQLDDSSTRRYGGTGLGWTISQRLARLMGGDISLRSELGNGSEFTFSFRADIKVWRRSQPVAVPKPNTPSSDRALNILVVEDHPVNRMIIEGWLKSSGHRTAVAENGQEAVTLAQAGPYDIILMDVNMPIMDGLTATRLIRDEKNPNHATPVVIISASARSEDHEAGSQAGADAYVDKPIDFGQLATILNLAAKGGRQALKNAA